MTRTTSTTIYFPFGRILAADAVASALKIPRSHLSESATYSEATVIIGTDWLSGNTYPAH